MKCQCYSWLAGYRGRGVSVVKENDKYYMEQAYIKKVFVASLTLKFNWASCVCFCSVWHLPCRAERRGDSSLLPFCLSLQGAVLCPSQPSTFSCVSGSFRALELNPTKFAINGVWFTCTVVPSSRSQERTGWPSRSRDHVVKKTRCSNRIGLSQPSTFCRVRQDSSQRKKEWWLREKQCCGGVLV